jgi:peptidyl-prolyl cis-trans isomerase C
MIRINQRYKAFLVSLALLPGLCLARTAAGSQVLATVGNAEITDTQLAQAMASAPFATEFPSMEEDQQAAVRGDMLLRLVNAEILRQEALARAVDRNPRFIEEVKRFRTSLLYRKYIQSLRDAVEIPAAVDADYKERFRGNPDALAAARSVYVARHFRTLKTERMADLKARHGVHVYTERLNNSPPEETVVAEGDYFRIHYRDIQLPDNAEGATESTAIERLNDLVEVTLGARAAQDSGIDVETEVAEFRHELLPRLLLEQQERAWIPGQSSLREYYQQHPEKWYLPERRHIGQLVLGSREQAEAMRERIVAGESLFVLAAGNSIDPLGRRQAGDMGWLQQGSGHPALEAAVKTLQPGEISAVIETPAGYHLVTLIERRPGRQPPLAEITDRVRQAMISEQLTAYLQALQKKYPVQWSLPVLPDEAASAGTATPP